ncbi:MAG: hypothetical protein ACXVRJ_13285 [Gaiellaceae bacterium]
MRRLLSSSLLLCLVSVLAVSGTQAVSPDPSELLQRYEPVLLFHPQEEWAPQTVESYLQLARVERQVSKGSWSPVPPPFPTSTVGCTVSPCLRLDLPCALRSGVACYRQQQQTDWQHPVVYGTVTVVPPNAPPPPGFTVPPKLLLHYWLFYAFDDWHSARSRLWQTHEGDWESITVGLAADNTPLFAAYSEHCSGTVMPWRAVTKRATTHPVAYVALGSHANWFSASAANTRFGECIKGGLTGAAAARAATIVRLAQEQVVDRMGTAHPLGPPGVAGVAPLGLVELQPAATAWARFPGRWGEGQILWLGSKPRSLTTVSQGYGPSTPRWGATTVAATWHPGTG